MNKHKKFIKDAYNGKLGLTMCSEWKEAIEETYPEFNEQVKLEVGKWYKYTKHDCNFLFNITGIDKLVDGGVIAYGFDDDSWEVCDRWLDDSDYKDIKPATDQEVKEALIKEAKKRGFEEGVMYQTAFGDSTHRINGELDFGFCGRINIHAKKSNGIIFENGKWGTIIETITKEEAEKQLGKTII